MYERWIDTYAASWASELLRFGRRVEAHAKHMSASLPVVDIALDVSIAAPRTAVFAALTADPGGWWGHPFLRSDATGITLARRLGGLLVETWENAAPGRATRTGWPAPPHLHLPAPFHLRTALGPPTFALSQRAP